MTGKPVLVDPEVFAVEGHVAGLVDGDGEEDLAVVVELHYGVVAEIGDPEMLSVVEEVYGLDADIVDGFDSADGVYLGHFAAGGVGHPEESTVEYGGG